MDKRRAIILGCSHAAGAEMGKDPKISLDDMDPADWGLHNSYPALIARALEYQLWNYALGGGSNDAMFRIWSELCRTWHRDDIVLACWTGRHRTEIYHPDHEIWLQVSPGTETYRQRIADDLHLSGRTIDKTVDDMDQYVDFTRRWNLMVNDAVSATNNKIKNIVALNVWAESLGIKVINFHSFDPMYHPLLDRFFWPMVGSFTDFCENKGFAKTAWGHYFLPAHREFADRALEAIHG